MFLHLAPDEKFVLQAQALFENVSPGQHTFILFKHDPTTTTDFPVDPARTLVMGQDARLIADRIRSMSGVVGLILHSLPEFSCEVVGLLPRGLPIFWHAWGYDVYDRTPSLQLGIYQPETLKFFHRTAKDRMLWRTKLSFKSVAQRLGFHWRGVEKRRMEAMRRIDFCAPVLPEEDAIVRWHCGFKGAFLKFNYGWTQEQRQVISGGRITGHDIFIGNSSTPTSNHLDAFERLRGAPWRGRKIIVPLSYGYPDYRAHVLRVGRELFGDAFEPVTEFLNFQAFVTLMMRCSVHILNHNRQQAVGNLAIGLLAGARIFMSPRSSAYRYFRKLGASLSEVDRDLPGQVDQPLTADERELNRKVAEREYSERAMEDCARTVLRKLADRAGGNPRPPAPPS